MVKGKGILFNVGGQTGMEFASFAYFSFSLVFFIYLFFYIF